MFARGAVVSTRDDTRSGGDDREIRDSTTALVGRGVMTRHGGCIGCCVNAAAVGNAMVFAGERNEDVPAQPGGVTEAARIVQLADQGGVADGRDRGKDAAALDAAPTALALRCVARGGDVAGRKSLMALREPSAQRTLCSGPLLD